MTPQPPKKPHRFRSGSAGPDEDRYQKTVGSLIPKVSFQRLVREVAWAYKLNEVSFRRSAQPLSNVNL